MASFVKELSDEKLVKLLRDCYQFEPTSGVLYEMYRIHPREFGSMVFTRANIMNQCALEISQRVMLGHLAIVDRRTGEHL